MLKHVLRSYWNLLEGYRLKAVALAGITALSGLMEGVALLCLIPMLNNGLKIVAPIPPAFLEIFGFAWNPTNREKMLVVSLVLFTALGILSAVARVISETQIFRLQAAIELSLRTRLTKALLSMQWGKFISLKFGEISKAMLEDGHIVSIGARAIILFSGVSIVCLILAVLAFGLSPRMTLLTLMFGLLALLISKRISFYSNKYAPALEAASSSLASSTEQYFSNLKFIKSFGLNAFAERDLSAKQRDCAHNFVRSSVLYPLVRFSFESMGIFFIGLIVAFAYWIAPAFFGRLIVFLAVFYRIAPRLISIHDSYALALAYEPWYGSWKRVFDFAIENRDQVRTEEPLPFNSFREISFDNVAFQYADRPILRNISFVLSNGKMLAVVGESGGGKTTILDLVTGLISPTAGTCKLNGMSLQNVPIDEWRSKIGLVMQNSPIFHATVLENIAMSDRQPDVQWAIECAKLAHAWEFIERLPQKLETKLGQKGASLSQGECQRLSLARALYRKPWLLILDETTSSLDAQSESYILDTLKLLKGRMAILMVSHRLSTVGFVDEILFLGAGEVRERGTYKDLMDRPSGDFKHFASLQGIST